MNNDTDNDTGNDVNDDETEAEDEAEQDLESEFEAKEEIAAPKRAKFNFGFLLNGFVLSIVLGGTLGIVGSKILAGPDKTIALRTELQQSLDDLRQVTQTQTKQLGTAANNIQQNAKTRLDTLQSESRTLAYQVEAQKQTIAQLQNNTEANLKTLTDRIAVLEALSGENTDVFVGAGSITARLDALEKSVMNTNNAQAQDIAGEVSTKLPEETFANEAMSVMQISAKPAANPTGQAALDVLINTFPRSKMLVAVKAQEKTASKKTGWLKRALSKHIRVGNDNAPDPYATINAAETALRNGHVTAALEQIAQLNPPVRTSAAEWVQAAKKVAPSIE